MTQTIRFLWPYGIDPKPDTVLRTEDGTIIGQVRSVCITTRVVKAEIADEVVARINVGLFARTDFHVAEGGES
jgi:hypothetical protein